jgi:thiol:disulfide interchange protein DsbD
MASDIISDTTDGSFKSDVLDSESPVLVDFWATWCKNCLVMDRTTLIDPAVVQALDGYVKIKVQAEDPDASPTRELLQRLRAPGLPAYAILHAR